MRWTGMPMAMWAVFAKSFEKQLTAVLGYDPDTARKITEKAKPKYREIIAKLPKFEKGDRFSMNIIGCAMLGAFVLSMPHRPDVESLTDYYENAQMTPLMKWFCRNRLYDLTPAMCHLDYAMSEAGGVTNFVRQYTLVSGGPYCDCGYQKKRV